MLFVKYNIKKCTVLNNTVEITCINGAGIGVLY